VRGVLPGPAKGCARAAAGGWARRVRARGAVPRALRCARCGRAAAGVAGVRRCGCCGRAVAGVAGAPLRVLRARGPRTPVEPRTVRRRTVRRRGTGPDARERETQRGPARTAKRPGRMAEPARVSAGQVTGWRGWRLVRLYTHAHTHTHCLSAYTHTYTHIIYGGAGGSSASSGGPGRIAEPARHPACRRTPG
jgi:hypothetical protein